MDCASQKLAEDVILLNWRKAVVLADAYSTGSSLMPQKKNPDALELLRGKAGRVIGHATGFMCTLKGLPRSYNKDLQEDKEALFDALDTVHSCLKIAAGVMATMVPREEKLRAELVPEMLATDLAEYLVRKGVPFRETHHISGGAIKLSEDLGIPVSELTLEQLKGLHELFEEDVLTVLRDYECSVERKDSVGGTSRRSVLEQVRSRICAHFTRLTPFTHSAYGHSINRWKYCESLLTMRKVTHLRLLLLRQRRVLREKGYFKCSQ